MVRVKETRQKIKRMGADKVAIESTQHVAGHDKEENRYLQSTLLLLFNIIIASPKASLLPPSPTDPPEKPEKDSHVSLDGVAETGGTGGEPQPAAARTIRKPAALWQLDDNTELSHVILKPQ